MNQTIRVADKRWSAVRRPRLNPKQVGETFCPRWRFSKIILTALFTVLCLIVLLLVAPQMPARAQEENDLELRLSRNFGYSSGAGRIQGNFTAKINGPEDLARVIFLIDGEEMGEAIQPPFELKFHTGSYPLGVHTIAALGYTSDGSKLTSNDWVVEFVAAEEGWQTAGKIALPLVGIIAIAMLASFLLPTFFGRSKKSSLPLGAPRSYGVLGGTICPKCQRPFGMHIWGLNLVIGKLDRCPHCGQWSLVRHMPAEMLRTAEAAELSRSKQAESASPKLEAESLNKDLEDSRYLDL